jgi:peptidase E
MQQFIAMGGGGFLMEDTPLLDDFILSRACGSASRVCFVATASGDRGPHAGQLLYRAWATLPRYISSTAR